MNNTFAKAFNSFRLALQVPSIYILPSKTLVGAQPHLYFLLFIILGLISSIIIRHNIIDFDSLFSPAYTFLFSLLLILTFAYIIYLEMNILWRIINGVKHYSYLLYTAKTVSNMSKKVIVIYYTLTLLGIILSIYILYVLYTLPVCLSTPALFINYY